MAAELGAHLVKTYYCDEFERIVQTCPVPVVIAGGPKLKNEYDVLKMAYDAVSCGARGVDMGRNIWQSRWPTAVLSAIRSIVHDNVSLEEANQIFERLKEQK
jgi:putative autoinducer-2 (AI-2) aldolase